MELQTKQAATMGDEQIVALYWQRDEQAIRETDIKYKKFLLSVAYNILYDICDSEECLNDTYIGAWNSIPPARPVLLQAFLATIMRRTAIDCYKAKKRQKRTKDRTKRSVRAVRFGYYPHGLQPHRYGRARKVLLRPCRGRHPHRTS